jgi:hypothetical protein
LLSLHSPPHAALFAAQEEAAVGVQHHWRKRAKNLNYYKGFREAQVVK